jgi:hypothetical protein
MQTLLCLDMAMVVVGIILLLKSIVSEEVLANTEHDFPETLCK